MANTAYQSTHTGAQIDAAIDAVANKANINSPAFTGTPTAPTAPASTDSTQIATTAFVQDVVEDLVALGPDDGSGGIIDSETGQQVDISKYALKTWVQEQGYLTQHQDISGKADKATTLAGYGITDAKIASGVITLGSNTITPVTDVSGKADKSATVSTVTYDTTNKKLRKTINGTTTDIVTASTIVTDGGGIKSHQSVVLATGTNDGTMKITVGGTATDNVAVKGFSDLVARVVTLEQNSVFYKGHYLTSNSPFAKNSAVYFNGRMFVSNAQTSDTPMPVYVNSSGNRLVLSDGGYIIASTTINSTWEEKYE